MSSIHSITVTTYTDLKTWRDDFLKPAGVNFLVIVGAPGTGKSRMFRDAASDEVFYHEGPMSGPKCYTTLYANRDRSIILDDVDPLLKHADNVNLLKLLCQSDTPKRLAWRKQNWRMDQDNVPECFTTTSRVCVLANKIPAADENLAAVLDRAHVIEFLPPADEVYRQVATWFKETDVYDFVGQHLQLFPEPSMRWYVKAAELKALGRDWQSYLLGICTRNPKLALAMQVLADTTLTSSDARVRRFAEAGGGSRDTYFRYQRLVRQTLGAGAADEVESTAEASAA